MRKNLNKIWVLTILILTCIFVPTISKAAVFNLDHTIGGIYKAMKQDPRGWINAPLPDLSGRWGAEALSDGGASMIHRTGGLCVGHTNLSWGQDPNGWQTIKRIVTTNGNNTDNIEDLKLAYMISKSAKNGETTSNAYYKQQIRLWAKNNAGLNQTINDAINNGIVDQGAIDYATSIKNQKLETNSKEGENAAQQILYKNGNTFIGPYNLNTVGGWLTGATITTREGTTITTDKYSTNGTSIGTLTSVTSYNGNSFYIVVQGKEVSSVKSIKVTKKFNKISARAVFTQNVGSGGQNVAVTYGTDLEATGYAEVTLPGVPYSKIKIKKIDEITGKPLANIGLVLRNTQYGYVKSGTPASFVSDISQATIFNTDKNGYIEIKNINKKGTFEILEVINPYYGYEEVSISKPKKIGTVTINSVGNNVETTVKNKRVYIKLSGYVWEDIANQVGRNNLWQNDSSDGRDKRLNNVKVSLKDNDGNILESKLTSRITNSEGKQEDGAYILGDYQKDPKAARIRIENLDKLRIEFEYNGMCYQSVSVNSLVRNGNKATDENSRNRFNSEYAIIANNESQNRNKQKTHQLNYTMNNHISTINYGGKYLYGYEGQKYPISGIDGQYLITSNTTDASPNKLLGQNITKDEIYKSELTEIKDINLGLYEREMPDAGLTEDLCNIRVKFRNSENNHQYDYEHTYKYEQGNKSYQREMYTADVSYNSKKPDSLQVYLNYKMTLKNDSKFIHTSVNEIVSYFDSDYEVIDVKDDGNNKINYTQDKNFNNNYKKVKIDAKQTLLPGEQKNIYLQIKVQSSELTQILKGTKKINFVTEIASYSSYQDNTFKNSYAGIDKDSNPGNTIPNNKSTYEDDADLVSLDLTKKEGRITKGTIWEDTAIQNLLNNTNGYERQRKGDGKYIKGENVVKNVKVEILDSKTKEIAKLYKEDQSETLAQTTTNEMGEYSFTGIIPGKYLIRYTYGNTSIICDANGSEKVKVKPYKYKSTIYRNGEKSKAENMTDYWYRNEIGSSSLRISDAVDKVGLYEDGKVVDIVKERTTDSGTVNFETSKKEETLKEIEAETNQFDIKLESVDEKSNFNQKLNGTFDNIDFGIIERARQDLTISKEIAYIKVSLSSGQAIVEGDPRKVQMDHVKLLPDGNVSIELDEEVLQSANINIKYEIRVSNKKSEIDYNSKDYYIYGEIPLNYKDWRLATVTRLFDYLSNDLVFDNTEELNKVWEYVKVTKENLVDTGYLSEESYKEIKKYNRIFQTKEFKDMQPDSEKSIYLIANKLLANTTEDYDFRNDIEVNELKYRKIENSIPGNYIPTDSNTYEKDNDNKQVVITTPTGKNKNYIPYITLGISIFGILIAGILIIKKKVL